MPNRGSWLCSSCGGSVAVTDSRLNDDYRVRRYSCSKCGLRFSTVEVALPPTATISGHAGVLAVLADFLIRHTRNRALFRELGQRIAVGLEPKEVQAFGVLIKQSKADEI